MDKQSRKRNLSEITPTKIASPCNKRKTDQALSESNMAECIQVTRGATIDINVKSLLEKLKEEHPKISEKTLDVMETFATALDVELTKTVDFLVSELNDVKQKLSDVSKTYDLVNVENVNLKQQVVVMENRCRELENEQLRSEAYSMRNNLLLSGPDVKRFKVGKTEQELRKWFYSILWKLGCMNQVQIERIHWYRRTEKVIVRFRNFTDRQDLWRSRHQLSNKVGKVYISEHYPYPIQEARKVLIPISAEAVAQGMESHVVVDRLYIGQNRYTVDNLDDLPESLKPIRYGYKQSEEACVFFTKRSLLSNHAPTPFTYEKKAYSSGEQFWMREKALFHKDTESAAAVMDTDDPVRQKAIGRNVKDVNMKLWKENVRKILYPGLLEKFKQHEGARAALLNTGSRKIGEATTERYWGIGMKLADKDVLNTSKWSDENIVGNMLQDIRTDLVKLGY